MNIVLFGSRTFGAAVLTRLLAGGHKVMLTVTPPHRSRIPLDLGDQEPWDSCRQAAWLTQTPWAPSKVTTWRSIPECDLIVAAHSHDFIGRRTRARAEQGAIGYHPSLLPLHRGRDSVEWAVRMHDRVTGGTVYWLDDRVDGGPVILQDWCFIRPGDTARELWRRELAPMGERLVEAAVDLIQHGEAPWLPQDDSLATWEPALDGQPLYRPELRELDSAGKNP